MLMMQKVVSGNTFENKFDIVDVVQGPNFREMQKPEITLLGSTIVKNDLIVSIVNVALCILFWVDNY